jgi:hypothetical protein
MNPRALWVLVAVAVFAVALIAGLIALGAERNTPTDVRRMQPVSQLIDAPKVATVVSPPESQPLPSRTVSQPAGQAQAPGGGAGTGTEAGAGGGDTDVTVTNGTSSTDTESGGAHVNNNANVDASTGVITEDSGDNPDP